ncbi:MAG: translation elongation factor-like protein [Patescibacteria group bacterium]
MEEKPVGKISHFFNKISVGIIELSDELKVGDKIHIKGHATDFEQEVASMQVEHQDVPEAKKGDSVGTKVDQPVREHDEVFKVVE